MEITITATNTNTAGNIVERKHQKDTGEIAIIKNPKELHDIGVTKKAITRICVLIQKTKRYRVNKKIQLTNSGTHL